MSSAHEREIGGISMDVDRYADRTRTDTKPSFGVLVQVVLRNNRKMMAKSSDLSLVQKVIGIIVLLQQRPILISFGIVGSEGDVECE